MDIPKYLESRGWERMGEYRWLKGIYELEEPADDVFEIWNSRTPEEHCIFAGKLLSRRKADIVMGALGIT